MTGPALNAELAGVESGRELGRKSLSLLLATWGSSCINLVAGVLIARVLGPEAVGSLSFGFGLAGILMAVFLPGFDQAHLKRVAEGKDLGVCLATCGLIKLGLYALLVLTFFVASPWRHLLFETDTLQSVFLLLCAGRLLSNLSEIFTGALLARELAVERSIILLGSRGIRLVATLLVLVWLPDVRWVAFAYALEGATELLAGAFVVHGWHGVRLRAPSRESLTGYWRYARPLLLMVPIGMFQDSVDRVVVKQWAGLAAAGYYHVARGFWEILGTLTAYPSTFLFTRMSALFAARSPERDREARALFYSGVDKLLFATVPLGLGLWIVAGPAIAVIFGSHFAPAETAVRIFVVATLAANLFNPYTHVLYALEIHGRLVPVVLLRFALYLLALAILVPAQPLFTAIPAVGLAEGGAALSRLFLLVFPAWVYVGWTRKWVGAGFFRRSWVYVGGFALALAIFEGAGRIILSAPLPPFLTRLLAATAGFLAYTACLGILHPGTRENLRYFTNLLSPRRFVLFFRQRVGTL